MTAPVAETQEARCPRCGYDQRGVVATWVQTCPIHGGCSECGLAFEWAELFSDKVRKPRWCVEYAKRLWSIPARSFATFAVSCWPWGFWRSLKMYHEPRWCRLAEYYACIVIAAYLAFAIMQGAIMANVWIDMRKSGASTVAGSFGRIGFGSLAKVNSSLIEVVAPVLLWPWSDRSPGTITTSLPLAAPFPTPRSILPGARGSEVSLLDATGTWERWPQSPAMWIRLPPPLYPSVGWFGQDFEIAARLVAHTVLSLLFSTLAFALLPQSRRTAKVRWAHVIRIGLYGLSFSIVLLWLDLLNAQWHMLTFTPGATDPWWLFVPCFVLWPVAAVVWWSTATRHYLRMPHAWGIGAAVVVIGVLMSLACGSLSVLAQVTT